MSETLHYENGRAVLRMQRRLPHPPAKVWRALTDPDHLSQWFPATVTMDLAVGAVISFDFGDGPEPGGEIIQLDPPHVFAFMWDDSLLRFELHPDDGDERSTLLTFTHIFDDRAAAASYASGWHGCLAAMQQILAGRPAEHARPTAELHDAYVAKFGLDAGSVEATTGGWEIRFERQLTRPAETVWAVLATPPPEIGAPPPPGFTTEAATPGPVTAVRAPELLEYQCRTGRVRWELSDQRGTGHGARLTVTHTGRDTADQRPDARAAWGDRLRHLADQLRQRPTAD